MSKRGIFGKLLQESINETSAFNLLNKHSNTGYVIVSANRNLEDLGIDMSTEHGINSGRHENNKRTESLRMDIDSSGFSYVPANGGYIENYNKPNATHVTENSFIVFPFDNEGRLYPFEWLENFALWVCKTYNQDSVLVKRPNENPKYLKQDGKVDMEFSDKVKFDDFNQKYFTDLNKNSDKKERGKSTRFTFVP